MLATQTQYWANKEAKRHNLAMENLEKSSQTIKSYEAETNRLEAQIGKARMETEAVNALTAQKEADTRSAAQITNEQRLLQELEIARLNLGIAQQNADSTRQQAQSAAYLNYAKGDQSKTETVYIPYQTGANIAGSIVSTVTKAAAPVKNAAKGIKSGINTLLYNLRN